MKYTGPRVDPALKQYATPRQVEIIDAVNEHGSQVKAAKALGVNPRTLERALRVIRARAVRVGFAPEHDLVHPVPDGYRVKGASTLYMPDGAVALQWVKSEVDRERTEQMVREMCAALVEDIRGRSRPVQPPKRNDDTRLTAYCIGDAHVGMYAWADEAGEDYDLTIAESDLCGAMDRLLMSSPASETALIAQLGDYFHADDARAVTPQSGNKLDVDSRHLKVLRTGIKAMRYLIDAARRKHAKVIVRNVGGNHDPHASIALTLALAAYYERDSRVQIEQSPKPFWWMRWHNNLIGLTHGDGIKPDRMPGVLATEAAEAWACDHRYIWHGHIHVRQLIEDMGCLVESFRTLAARDAWHASQGYRAGREMQAIVLDREHGEIERHTCGVRLARHGRAH